MPARSFAQYRSEVEGLRALFAHTRKYKIGFAYIADFCAPHCARALLGAGCIGNGPRGERDAFSKTRTIVALRKWLRQIHPEADRLGDYRTDRYLLLRRPRRGGAGEDTSARSGKETVGVQSV